MFIRRYKKNINTFWMKKASHLELGKMQHHAKADLDFTFTKRVFFTCLTSYDIVAPDKQGYPHNTFLICP